MRKIILLLPLTICFLISYSQKDSTQIKKPKLVVFEKTIMIGHDFYSRLWLGFGGPQLMFKLNRQLKIGPAYYPTLWWDYNTGEFDTKLGVGFRVDIKRIIIGYNTFRVKDYWVGSIGAGYKF